MARWQQTKNGKRSTRPATQEEPLIASVVVADYLDDADGSSPISDITVRNETVSQGQFIFQPFVDVQHQWKCGTLTVAYGFTVSGGGVLTIDAAFGTGRIFV